jgi:hypothetical protein
MMNPSALARAAHPHPGVRCSRLYGAQSMALKVDRGGSDWSIPAFLLAKKLHPHGSNTMGIAFMWLYSDYAAAAQQLDNQGHHREHNQDMNEPAHRICGRHSQ